jgi:hypothetical protein
LSGWTYPKGGRAFLTPSVFIVLGSAAQIVIGVYLLLKRPSHYPKPLPDYFRAVLQFWGLPADDEGTRRAEIGAGMILVGLGVVWLFVLLLVWLSGVVGISLAE